MEVYVHEHALKHGLSEEQIRFAWKNYVRRKYREPPREGQVLAVGLDARGTAMQMVGVFSDAGVLIFHAMAPPTRGALSELKMDRRLSW